MCYTDTFRINVVFGGFVTAVQDFSITGDATAFRPQISKYALYFVYLGLARFAMTYVYTCCNNIAATRITRKIRSRYLRAVLSQDVAFFDEGSHGSVASQIVTNGNMIHQGIAEKLGLTIQSVSAFVAAFVVAFVASAKLTGIVVCIVPTIVLVIGTVSSFDAKYETAIISLYAQAGSFAEDVISSIRTVHAFWARPKLVAKYNTFLEDARKIGNKKSPIYMVMFSTEFFAVYAGFGLAFWQGLAMYNRGELGSPGTIVTVLFSVVIATTSLTQLAPNIITFVSATSAAAALFAIMDRQSPIDPLDECGLRPESIRGEIELKNVSFTYPTRPNAPVLHDLSLTIPPGKVTALVGASGSGKSTIVALLERWYDPNSGILLLDGLPIGELNLQWLRTHVRLVQQEPVLFTGSVFENVRYGLVGTQWEYASDSEQRKLVQEACELAYAHDFVTDLPQGYDTEVGERAGLLSGGQKQRVAIARSIVSQPTVLLLDEATSALDPHAEGIVQKALDRASANRTTVVIAHKLATIKNADNIIVMAHGQILEQGTHESLIAAGGGYAKLVRIQDLGKAAEMAAGDDIENIKSRRQSSLKLESSMTRYATGDRERLDQKKNAFDYDQWKALSMTTCIYRLLTETKTLIVPYVNVFCACVIGGATYPAQALLFAHLMDVFALSDSQRTSRGNFFALMFFVVAIAQLFAYGSLGWATNTIAQTLTHKYRHEMFDSILRQDMQFFDRPENMAGAMTSRLSSDPQTIMELCGFNLALIFVTLVNLVSSCALAIAYSWRLGLVVVLAGIPPLTLSGWIRMQLDAKLQKDLAKRYAKSAALAGEAVTSIRTISSLSLEKSVLSRFEARLSAIVGATTRQTLYIMVFFALTQCMEFFFMGLGFYYGSTLLASGKISGRAFYVAFVGTFFSGQAASNFFSWSTSITKAKGGANYIFWLRSLKPSIAETSVNFNRGPPQAATSHAPSTKDLRFSYPLRPDTQVLRGVDIATSPGQFIALVGASGCGKSTLVAMFERFYDPVTGQVSLQSSFEDSRSTAPENIITMNPRLYRGIIGLVQQEPTLYQDTIRANIALGAVDETTDRRSNQKSSVSEDEIVHACKLANAWDFISSLPSSLDTQCGSRGLSLSGGQRQRIAIARALIRDPKILLLDEATSALDTESEKIVQAALLQAAREGTAGRVTIAVAHRLSTIKDADLICVFLNGKIADAGKHEELLARAGLYAKMCEAQSLDKAVPN